MSERSLEIWAEPLTDSEREIIERVKKNGTTDELRQWLGHVLACYDAMAEAAEARVAALTQALTFAGEVAESWHGDDEAKGRALAVISKTVRAALDGLVGLHEQEQR